MQIKIEQSGDLTLLRFEGRLDASTSLVVGKSVQANLQKGVQKLFLDMSGVSYVSSAGLRTILMAAKISKASSVGFALFGMQSAVWDVFDVSGFRTILVIENDLSSAQSRL